MKIRWVAGISTQNGPEHEDFVYLITRPVRHTLDWPGYRVLARDNPVNDAHLFATKEEAQQAANDFHFLIRAGSAWRPFVRPRRVNTEMRFSARPLHSYHKLY